MTTRNRTRARELAAESLAQGDPTGWFETLYQEAERGETAVPWADLRPNPNLLSFWEQDPLPTEGRTALTVGCGLGDDAEQLAAWGFETTAFDVAPSAVRAAKARFPASKVNYQVADVLSAPEEWRGKFDFVFEAYTLQALPVPVRALAMARVAAFVKPGGVLLLIARGREEDEPEGDLPWPLTRTEIESLDQFHLRVLSIEDFVDDEDEPVRRFCALYQKPRAN